MGLEEPFVLPQSPWAHTHPQPAPVPTGHLAVPLPVAFQGLRAAPWAVSLSLRTRSAGMEGASSGVNKAVTTSTPAPHGCPGRCHSHSLCPKGLLSQPHLSAPLMTLAWARDSNLLPLHLRVRGRWQRGIPGKGKGKLFPSPICCHLLPAQSCRISRQTSPLWLKRGPHRVWGAAGHTAARAACPGSVSSAGTPHPVPGGSGSVLCPLVPLLGC